MRKKEKIRNLLAAAALLFSMQAHADPLALGDPIEPPGPFIGTVGYLMSDDGTVVVGGLTSAPGFGATNLFRWTLADGALDIGSLGGDTVLTTDNLATALGLVPRSMMSSDGSVITGSSEAGGNFHAFAWAEGFGIVDLGTLPGDTESCSNGVSANATVIIGYSGGSCTGVNKTAFKWTVGGGMEALDFLTGGTKSSANEVSADGSVIVGFSNDTAGSDDYAVRWVNGVIESLGTVGGYDDYYAYKVSSDGSVVVGTMGSGGLSAQGVFRWEGGTMEELTLDTSLQGITGVLPSSMSSDGNVIGGIGLDFGNSLFIPWVWTSDLGVATDISLPGESLGAVLTVAGDGSVVGGFAGTLPNSIHAFLWTPGDGRKFLMDMLTDASINPGDWSDFFSVAKLNSDGSIALGTGLYNGQFRAFIFSTGLGGGGGGGGPGVITPEELAESLHTTSAPLMQGRSDVWSGMEQSMFAARSSAIYFPTGGSTGVSSGFATGKRKAAYAYGAFGAGRMDGSTDLSGIGAAGVMVEASSELTVGAGVIGGKTRRDTRLGGTSISDTTGISGLVSYEPAGSRLRVRGTLAVAALNAYVNRHYLNGGSIDASKGETDGYGLGVATQVGYMLPGGVMPFVDAQAVHTSLDGYIEKGGAFPASVSMKNDLMFVTRVGAEVKRGLNARTDLALRGAYGHRFTEGATGLATAATLTQTVPASQGNRDWLEAGGALHHKLTNRVTLSGDLTARVDGEGNPSFNATLGAVWGF